MHYSLPNGDMLSIAVIHNRTEVAVLRRGDFVPVGTWYYKTKPIDWDYGDDRKVLTIGGSAEQLSHVVSIAVRWAQDDVNSTAARAWDQAL